MFTPEVTRQLREYQALLKAGNQRINLISRKDTGSIAEYHIPDSLTALGLIPERAQVCDLGAGAGLPGIPLKIARPDIVLTLVESVTKKARFLSAVVRRLGLTDTEVLNLRAEEICDRHFDVVLCRLVGKIAELAPIAARLLRTPGIIIFYKSETVAAELHSAKATLAQNRLVVDGIYDFRVGHRQRRLVVIRNGRA